MENLGIECKKLMAKEIKQRLKDSSHLILCSFNALGVGEQDQLRRNLKEVNASMFVVKNRMAEQVFDQSNLKNLKSLMQGLTAIALGSQSDVVCLSRALVNFAAQNENFKVLAGYVDEQVLDSSSIKRLSTIPSREVLLTQVVRGFNFPIQGLVNTLSGAMKNFLVVIEKIREKKQEVKDGRGTES